MPPAIASPMTQVDFESVMQETHSRIRAYIAGMGIASHEVDDVAQDVYLELYKCWGRIPEDVEPARWLKGIARNLCLNHLRRRARRGRLHHDAVAELLAERESELEAEMADGRNSIGYALEGCLQRLAPKSRRMLLLKYEQDLSSQAIAAALESTAEAIRVAMHRVRRQLRTCIDRTLSRDGAT